MLSVTQTFFFLALMLQRTTRSLRYLNPVRYLQILYDLCDTYLFIFLSNNERASDVVCYSLCVSSHISTCCLMEACNIVLILTLLFSIKGQTVQNSTVIPHTLCSHFTPVFFFSLHTVLPCIKCAQ